MHQLSESEISQLAEKKFLDRDGHPSFEAYQQVFLSASADFSNLAISLELHGRDCPICYERYHSASNAVMLLFAPSKE